MKMNVPLTSQDIIVNRGQSRHSCLDYVLILNVPDGEPDITAKFQSLGNTSEISSVKIIVVLLIIHHFVYHLRAVFLENDVLDVKLTIQLKADVLYDCGQLPQSLQEFIEN